MFIPFNIIYLYFIIKNITQYLPLQLVHSVNLQSKVINNFSIYNQKLKMNQTHWE